MKTKLVVMSIFILLPAAVWLHGKALSGGSGAAAGQEQQQKGCAVETGREPSTPSEVVCTFYALAARGKIKEALSHQTADSDPAIYRSNIPVSPGWAELARDGIIKFSKIETETIEGDKAEVVAGIIERNGNVTPMVHNLYKQEGRWKIYSYFNENNRVCREEPEQCHIIKKRPRAEQQQAF